MNTRVLQNSRGRFRNEARELLQLFFAAEVVKPSERVYVVSPWLRDIELFDNTTGSFADLVPDAPRRVLRLTDIFRCLLVLGTRIVLVVRAPRDDGGVGQALEEIATALDRTHLVSVVESAELHSKGLLGAHAALTGSMNVTHAGLERNTELLQFHTDGESIGRLRLEFTGAYGR